MQRGASRELHSRGASLDRLSLILQKATALFDKVQGSKSPTRLSFVRRDLSLQIESWEVKH
jgi:hypothetical protein